MGFTKHLPNFPDLLVYHYSGEEYGNEWEIYYTESKWHAAEQRGNVYVVEQLGTIYCLQNINGELTILGQNSTLQSLCQLPPFVWLQQGKVDAGDILG